MVLIAFTELQENDTQDYLLNNFLPIPALLMEAYLRSPDKDPASIGTTFVDAFHTYDQHLDKASNDDSEDKCIVIINKKDKFSENYLCAL